MSKPKYPLSVSKAVVSLLLAKQARAIAWPVWTGEKAYFEALDELGQVVRSITKEKGLFLPGDDQEQLAEEALEDALRVVDMTALDTESQFYVLGLSLLEAGRNADQVRAWFAQASQYAANDLPASYIETIAARCVNSHEENISRKEQDERDANLADLIAKAQERIAWEEMNERET